MNKKIIKTIKSKSKNPFVSFILSLFFTGLGQIYNGKPLKGIAFFTLRALSLVIIPLYVHFKHLNSSYIVIYTAASLFFILITLISPFEALFFTLKNRIIRIKKYNSGVIYVIFATITTILYLAAIISMVSFFKIEKISDKDASLLFNTGDYILIKKYNPNGYNKGELIAYHENKKMNIARVMATEGDSIKLYKNTFYINNTPLPVGILNDSEMIKFSLDNYIDILSEINNKYKYPVKIQISKTTFTHKKINIIIKKNELLTVKDNRLQKDIYRLIAIDSITGRIEGIIFSNKFRKYLLRPYIKL